MATAATISAKLILDSAQYERGLGDAKRATDRFSSQIGTIGSKLTSIGGMMSAAFTLPIVAGATAAGKAYIDLDTQMKNIHSIATTLSEQDIQKLRQDFIGMSTDLSVTRDSAAKLAEAFYFIQSAGFAGSAGMEVLRVSTKAASAGLTDTMVAGNAILAVLNAYGMEADQAAYVSDVLFKTVDVGVLTFNDLASQLGDVVQTASMTSVPIADVGAALALMTRKGISTSESVTALNQLLLQFISPSKKMAKAAGAIGVGLNVDTLRTYGLAGALDLLIQKGGSADILLTLFGDNVRALKAALALGGQGLDEFNTMQEQFADVTGRTQQAFQTQTTSTAAKIDNFKNKITALGLTLADIFIPVLTKVIDAIVPFVDKLTNAPESTKMWIVGILAVVAVIGPLLVVLGMLATALSAILTLVAAISAPIWIVIAVVVALIAVIGLLALAWHNNWWGIQEKTRAVWLSIQTAIQTAINWLREFFSGHLGWLSVLFANAWNHIKFIISMNLANIQVIFQAFRYAFQGNWYMFGAFLRIAWDNMWRAIKQSAIVGWENLKILFSNVVTGIKNFFTQTDWNQVGISIVEGIGKGIQSMTGWIVDRVMGLVNAITQTFNGFFGIHSPSTYMMQRAAMLVEGLNIGWERNLSVSPVAMFTGQVSQPMLNRPSVIQSSQPSTQTNPFEDRFDYVKFARAIAQEFQRVK